MKTLKTLSILFLSVLILSCSKDDDSDGGGSAPDPEFNATINGGSFGDNYSAQLGSYSTDRMNGLTIAVTDTNANIIRFFLNETGGFNGGVIKNIGDVDENGFVTNAIVRDQEAMVTYNATKGAINITEVTSNPENEDGSLISGSFSITTATNNGTTVTVEGSFKKLAY